MLKNILVPLDGSDYSWSAARHSIQIARCFQATIYGLTVTDIKLLNKQFLNDLKVDSETVQHVYQDKGCELLKQLENECKDAGVNFSPRAVTGMVAKSICQIIQETKSDMVAIGKKGINANWSEPLLGSTAESLVRQAKRPIFLSQEKYNPIESAYVAYDGAIVSIMALRFTAELCAQCKWKMNVITIHRSPARREKLLNQAVETAELYSVKINKIGLGGDVTKHLLEATASEPNALIVLGAYSRRLRELILGNVPERIIHRAPQPVLIYRPPK